MRGAIVLAGGASRRFGAPKAFARLGGDALVVRVARAAAETCDEVVVATRGTMEQRTRSLLDPEVRVVRDGARIRTPLVGLAAGSAALRSPYALALACDHPLLEPRLLAALFRHASGRDAAVPVWPDGRLEPLLAVYRRSAMSAAIRAALDAGERSGRAMVSRLADVRFVRTEALRREDPGLRSLLNVNRPMDLARAEALLASPRRP